MLRGDKVGRCIFESTFCPIHPMSISGAFPLVIMDLYPASRQSGTAFWDMQIGVHIPYGLPRLI